MNIFAQVMEWLKPSRRTLVPLVAFAFLASSLHAVPSIGSFTVMDKPIQGATIQDGRVFHAGESVFIALTINDGDGNKDFITGISNPVSGKEQSSLLELGISNPAYKKDYAVAAVLDPYTILDGAAIFVYRVRPGDFVRAEDIVISSLNTRDYLFYTKKQPKGISTCPGNFSDITGVAELSTSGIQDLFDASTKFGVQTVYFIDSVSGDMTNRLDITIDGSVSKTETVTLTRGDVIPDALPEQEYKFGIVNSDAQRRILQITDANQIVFPKGDPKLEQSTLNQVKVSIEAFRNTAPNTPVTISFKPGGKGKLPEASSLTLNVTVINMPTPSLEFEPAAGLVLEESDKSRGTFFVTLPEPASKNTTIELTIASLEGGKEKLVFDRNAGTLTKEVTILKGKRKSPSIYLYPLNGCDLENGSAFEITAREKVTSGDADYSEAVYEVSVRNLDPVITGLSVPPSAMAGKEVRITWGTKDVAADSARIVTVNFGDGATSVFTAGETEVTHTYAEAGKFKVQVTVEDPDDGRAESEYREIDIRGRTTVTVVEIEEDNPMSYKGVVSGLTLPGLGKGSIFDRDHDDRTPLEGEYSWTISYPDNKGSATLRAEPESFVKNGIFYNSFFHAWDGSYAYDVKVEGQYHPGFIEKESLFPIRSDHYAGVIISVPMTIDKDTGTSQKVEDGVYKGVFSREYFPEDGAGDIDADMLPDLWEQSFFGITNSFESPSTTMFNEDEDFLPRGLVIKYNAFDKDAPEVKVEYPLKDYAPTGVAFGNYFEARGFHVGLNMNMSKAPFVANENGDTTETVDAVTFTRTVYSMVVAEALPWDEAKKNLDKSAPGYTETYEVENLKIDPADYPCEEFLGYEMDKEGVITLKFVEVSASVAPKTRKIRAATEVWPKDEPRRGDFSKTGRFIENDERMFFGTDPRQSDSDGDGLTDGWEYYFWYLATCSTNELNAERWNPRAVTTGIPLSRIEISMALHPMSPQTNGGDTDGDGLSDWEEMILGTNPIHWDTDGDGMNDGWETMWGLNPLDAGDSTENYDGDWMAFKAKADLYDDEGNVTNTVELRHADVRHYYDRFRQGSGYDPRTAWIGDIAIDRYQGALVSAPDTKSFSNWEEHFLGRWCLDHGITEEVPPITRDYMTQPTPRGYLRFVMTNSPLNSITTVARDWTVSAIGGVTNVVISTNLVSTGVSVAGTLVMQIGVETHGYDSDSDGMPDGWELYCFMLSPSGTYPIIPGGSSFFSMNLWPTSHDGTSAYDADQDYDFDSLSNLYECHSSVLIDYYKRYNSDLENVNERWLNKFWPTNPWNLDTDMDGVWDAEEGVYFTYATDGMTEDAEANTNAPAIEKVGSCFPGGGLNPCTVDTDADYIPDAWEVEFMGAMGTDEDNNPVWGGGMNGTIEDAHLDYDGDGLVNYQEYWTGAVPHLHYSRWTDPPALRTYDQSLQWNWCLWEPNSRWRDDGTLEAGDLLPLRGATPDDHLASVLLCKELTVNDPILFFDGYRMDWDWNYFTGGTPLADVVTMKYVVHTQDPKFFYIPTRDPLKHATTDPRDPDSDHDGMDDYYEMFHGLNPLLGTTDDIVKSKGESDLPAPVGDGVDYFNFRLYPWLTGIEKADPDQDGVPNFEEALLPMQSSPQPAHTDPSPLWMTDMSYDKSFVNLGYTLGWVPMYWSDLPQPRWYDNYDPKEFRIDRPSYMYTFEMNEGYDTDNDTRGDKQELVPAGTAVTTDPLNTDNPGGYKSLYLDGNSAARTLDGCRFGPKAFHSWTVQLWFKPERVTNPERQILIERPVFWRQKDTEPSFEMVRRTFRLGIETDGRPFVEFDNGGTEAITENAIADKSAIVSTNWNHIAATMDGVNKRLSLYINGEMVASKSTALIPYSGFFPGTGAPSIAAPIVIGAADSNPNGRVDGLMEHYHAGGIFERMKFPGQATTEPVLSKYFKGWIDEVSIWTGARSGMDIRKDYAWLTRYTIKDVISMRERAVNTLNRELLDRGFYVSPYKRTFDEFYSKAQDALMETGAETLSAAIPPTLIAHYNFDALPDYRTDPPEPVVARGFDKLNGRPADYTGVPFWETAKHRTTIYQTDDAAPYVRLPFIKNTVSMVPMGHMYLDRERIHKLPGALDIGSLLDSEKPLNFVEIAPEVLSNALCTAFFVADSQADSVYWKRYEKGGVENEDGIVHTYPNSANPYGITYQHDRNYWSQRSIRTIDEVYDPVYATLFNDILPLKGAYVDGQVPDWGDSQGTHAGTRRDSDGDGLTDKWELANGMDPFNWDQNGNGIVDAYDDFDNDGLSNAAEEMIGTDPWDSCTAPDGLGDYYDGRNGALFTDNDYVDDKWESLWKEQAASPSRYDEHLDWDNDGWNNWSERQATNNSTRATGFTSPADAKEVPIPTLLVTIDYSGGFLDSNFGKSARWNEKLRNWESWDGGSRSWIEFNPPLRDPNANPAADTLSKLVVYVYSDESMNGKPDAIYVKDIDKPENWPLMLILDARDLEYGHVRQGKNWFYAFIDMDGSLMENTGAGGAVRWYTWTSGEPSGVADGQWPAGIDIGVDINTLRIPLSEKSRSYARLDFSEEPPIVLKNGKEGHEISIVETAGQKVFEKALEWPRTELHDGDFMAGVSKNLGLSAARGSIRGTATSREYMWYLDDRFMGYFTNYFDKDLIKPIPILPKNDLVYTALVNFSFRLTPDATEFIFRLYRVENPDTPIFEGRYQAPGRAYWNQANYDLVQWTFPYSVGSTLPGGEIFSAGKQEYIWTIASITPKVESQAGTVVSEPATFTVATGDDGVDSGKTGGVVVRVVYPYATNGACAFGQEPVLRVQAFRNLAFSGVPEAERSFVLTPELASQISTNGVDVVINGLQPVGLDGEQHPFGEALSLGRYYIRAFIDQNNDFTRQCWESWGYCRDNSNVENPFRPTFIMATALDNAAKGNIEIRDADTDNDKLPDSWEFVSAVDPDTEGAFLAKLGYGALGQVVTLRENYQLGPYADSDGDGISDFDECYVTGTSPLLADSDGDGVDDRTAYLMGFSDPMRLAISSVDLADSGLTLMWNWDFAKKGTTSMAAPQRKPVKALASSADYAVEWSSDLSDPNGWKVFTTTISSDAAVGIERVQLTPEMEEAKSLFFRVRLIEK